MTKLNTKQQNFVNEFQTFINKWHPGVSTRTANERADEIFVEVNFYIDTQVIAKVDSSGVWTFNI